ncbi:uncharacterized protein LOC135336253 isoform X2 [Halichondria panicea]|uniref:uncharacterized protein LOC135336253 isoform X2 n=1 Tax=Halichondria panicea TaxID=6063 RepID=UPI00312B455F
MAELVAHSMASSFGGGLHNMGNTCFANSVLQGMFYTSRIQKVLCDERVPHGKENINNAHSIVHVKFVTEHSQGSEQLCMVCTLKSLYDECQTRSQVHPSGIYSQLKSNQEDAHEFMLAILDRINSHLVVDENMTQSAMDKVMATLLSTTGANLLQSTKVHNVGNECISQELILLCCKDVPTLHRVCNGGKYVQESEIKGNLPDEVVDEDLISIQSYFSKKLLDKKVQAKRTEWKCGAITSKWNMVMCDSCFVWYHWSCTDIEVEKNTPSEDTDWYCRNCENYNNKFYLILIFVDYFLLSIP